MTGAPVGVWVQREDACTAACLPGLPAHLTRMTRLLHDEAMCPRCGSWWIFHDRAFVVEDD